MATGKGENGLVLNGFHILIVEDDPSDSMFITRVVGEQCRQSVQVVADGIEALDYLYQLGIYADSPRPDLILLDIKLPRKDGGAVLMEMRADTNLKSIPVIILTSANTEEERFRAFARIANGYIRKTTDLSEFSRILQRTVNMWRDSN
jgi:two-component system, chemotaxis family, response regulator Rcp1